MLTTVINGLRPGKEARLLYAEGVLSDTPQDIINGFECQRHLNQRVQHWVGHISRSYSPKDSTIFTDDKMVKFALEYMERMGIKTPSSSLPDISIRSILIATSCSTE